MLVKNIFSQFLDIILPRPNFDKDIAHMSPDVFIDKSGGSLMQSKNNIYYLLNYRNRFVRDSIWSLKYRGNKHIARMFAILLYDHLVEEESENYMFGEEKRSVIVPLPISKKHLRERGWNHVGLILKELQKIDSTNFIYDYSGLIKTKNTISQTKTKNRKERETNIMDSFDVIDSHGFLDKNIILIDDVMTTGSTLREAKKILLEAGVKSVTSIAIAH